MTVLFNHEVLNKVITLITLYAQKPESSDIVVNALLSESLLSEVDLLSCIHFLQCDVLFPIVLSHVADRIFLEVYKPGNMAECELLYARLSGLLKAMIQEILLVKYGLIANVIQLKRFSDDTGTSRIHPLSIERDNTLCIWRNGKGFCSYDLSPVMQKTADYAKTLSKTSPDANYTVVICEVKTDPLTPFLYTAILIQNQTNKRFFMEAYGSLYCSFSKDSKYLILENTLYDTKTGMRVDSDLNAAPDNGMPHSVFAVSHEQGWRIDLKRVNYDSEGIYINFVAFEHPEFAKLKHKEDGPTFCKQLPKDLFAKPLDLKISNDARYACILVKKEDYYRPAKISGQKKYDQVLIYDISNISDVKVIAQERDVRDFALCGSVAWITYVHDSVLHRIDLAERQKSVFTIAYDEIAFNPDGLSFVTLSWVNNSNQLKKMTLHRYVKSINDVFAVDIISFPPANMSGSTLVWIKDTHTILLTRYALSVPYHDILDIPLTTFITKSSLKEFMRLVLR